MAKFIGLILFCFSIYACSTSGKMVKEDTDTGKKEVKNRYDESFDPLSLDDEDIVISKKAESESKQNPDNKISENHENEAASLLESEGFRVQIFATRSFETATFAQQKAVDKFADSDYKVYLKYEAPLYRIRIGDATSRSDAEDIRELAKGRGYDEAFIVRSKVMIPEDKASDVNEGF